MVGNNAHHWGKIRQLVILDPFADLSWVDMSPSAEQFHPHMKLPYVLELKNNRRFFRAVEDIKVFLDLVQLPVLIIVLCPHPRYITQPCCKECRQDWDLDITPQQLFD